jgi:HK97 family phage major capsid protein
MTTLTHTPGTLAGQYLRALATGRGDMLAAAEFAKSRGWSTAGNILEKAAASALDAATLASVFAPIALDLQALLRPATLLGRMPAVRRVPFRTRLLTHDVGGAGAFVGEGQPVPVSEAGISDFAVLDRLKVAGIRVVTLELARQATSDAAFAADAIGGVAEALDVALVDPANGGDSATPRSITHPDSAVQFESSGATLAAIDADLRRLLDALTDRDMPLSSAVWVMAPRTATFLSLLRDPAGGLAFPGVTPRGGTLLGLPVLASRSVRPSGSPGESLIALVEQSEIAVADDNGTELDLTTKAAVQLSSTPANGAQQLVSLYQLGLVGIRATRYVNWRVRRTGAVAVLRSVLY